MPDPIIPEYGAPETPPPSGATSTIGNFSGITSSDAATGGIADADSFAEQLYKPIKSSSLLTFEGINGQIIPDAGDLSNLEARHIQPKSLADAHMVGLTGNADYRCDHFFANDHDSIESYRPIPGACIEFYLPKKSTVILTWMIGGANDTLFGVGGNEPYEHAAMALQIDGENTAHTGYRNITRSTHSVASGEPKRNNIQRPHRDRVWSGHYFVTLEAGWHSAGIVCMQTHFRLKFRTRNMKAIWFPQAGE